MRTRQTCPIRPRRAATIYKLPVNAQGVEGRAKPRCRYAATTEPLMIPGILEKLGYVAEIL